MQKERILLFGASQHCRSTIDIIEREGKYEVAGVLDDALSLGMTFGGYPVLGKISDLPAVMGDFRVGKGLIAIGDNFTRMKIAERIQNMASGFGFVSAIHPSAILGKNVTIGMGSVIMPGVIINNDSEIGVHCLLSNKVSLDHDSVVSDFSSLAPGVTTGGCVRVGTCTAIGLGANIIHGISIGDHTVIGAGSVVVRPIGDHVVAFGNPCKVIKTRTEGARYL